MRFLLRAAVAGLLVLPLLGSNSEAQQTQSEQIEELKMQMEEIQRQNQEQIQELQRKIEELEAKEAEKAAAVEEEKEEKDIEIEYKKPGDGFRLKTPDGNFSLRTRLRAQFQVSVNDTDDEDTATNFDIRRLRLTFDGNAFTPWLFYTVQLDADSGNVALRDAYFDAAYNTLFAPRVGQYKVPFSREELNSSSELQLVERSIVNGEFGFGRDIGGGVYGVLGNLIAYGAGVFNADGRNGSSENSNLLYAGRVMFTPCCGELEYKPGSFVSGGDYEIEPNFGEDYPLIAIGLAAAGIPDLDIAFKTPDNDIDERFEELFGEDDEGDVIGVADVITATADVNFKYRIFSIEGDYFIRKIEGSDGFDGDATDQGFRVQSGIFLLPEFIEVAGRFALIDYDDDVDGRDLRYEITPGLNFYLSRSHKWKLQFSYSFIRDEDTAEEESDQNAFRAQLQAYF